MRNINLAWTSNEINWLKAFSGLSIGNIKLAEFKNYVDTDGNKDGTRSDGI